MFNNQKTQSMRKALEILNPDPVKIDIGSKNFLVDAGEEVIKVLPTLTEGCHATCDYFLEREIKTIAMEATGVHWVNSEVRTTKVCLQKKMVIPGEIALKFV